MASQRTSGCGTTARSASLCKLVAAVEPLHLRRAIWEFREGGVIECREDLTRFVEYVFDVIMEPPDDLVEAPYQQVGETLADLLVLLRLAHPQFCSCGKKLSVDSRCCLAAQEKGVTFTRILFDHAQDQFARLAMQLAEETRRGEVTKRLEYILTACVTFIGRLYVRKLFTAKVVTQVVAATIGVSKCQPHPGAIRCVCELVCGIGQFMEDSKPGESLMSQFLTRMDDLAGLRMADVALYEQEIRDKMTDIHDTRSKRWPTLLAARVTLSYQVVDRSEAVREWQTLQKKKALPRNEEIRGYEEGLILPPGEQGEGEHITVQVALSGRTIAVAMSQNVQQLTHETLAELIESLTGIYRHRIVLA